MQNPQSPGFGAKCAIHPDRIATRTCSRCGNFTCEECNAAGVEAMCPTCRNLTGANAFPFTRDNYSFGGIWNYAFEKWKQEWVMLSVCVLILMAAGFVAVIFNAVFQGIAGAIVGSNRGTLGILYVTFISTVMSQAVSMIVQGAFVMGLLRILIDVLNGKKADVARIMTQLPKLGRYILQVILVQLMIVVPVLLYMVGVVVVAAIASGVSIGNIDNLGRSLRGAGVGILVLGFLAMLPVIFYAGLPLIFATMELVYGNTSPVESIRRSYLIANGHRLSILGFGVIAVLVVIAGFFACCIGMIPAMSLAYLVVLGLYLALRNGSGLPPPVEN